MRNPSSAAIGGAGRRPSAIRRKNSSPLIDRIVSSGATPTLLPSSPMPIASD